MREICLSGSTGKQAFTKLKLRDWQRDFIQAVYAEDKNGNRPVRTAIMSVARKNGKTQLAAALALCRCKDELKDDPNAEHACETAWNDWVRGQPI
jgi:phage terminase large subunit-like protein